MDEDGAHHQYRPHHHQSHHTTFKMEDITPSAWDYETGLPVVGAGATATGSGWHGHSNNDVEEDEEDDEEEEDEDEDDEEEDDDEDEGDDEEVDQSMSQPPLSTVALLPPPPPPLPPLTTTTNAVKGSSSSSKSKSKASKNDPSNATTTKKKIRRIRPLRSCLACNKRKIKCDRDSTAGCTPCRKRGEGDSCSLVAGLNNSHLTNVAIAERLAQLEARVDDLETVQQEQQQQQSPSIQYRYSGSLPPPTSSSSNGLALYSNSHTQRLEHQQPSTHSLPAATALEDSVQSIYPLKGVKGRSLQPNGFANATTTTTTNNGKGKGSSSSSSSSAFYAYEEQQQQQLPLANSNGGPSSSPHQPDGIKFVDGRRRSSRTHNNTNTASSSSLRNAGIDDASLDPALRGSSSSGSGGGGGGAAPPSQDRGGDQGQRQEQGADGVHAINREDKTSSGESAAGAGAGAGTGAGAAAAAAAAAACETEEAALALEILCNTGDVRRTTSTTADNAAGALGPSSSDNPAFGGASGGAPSGGNAAERSPTQPLSAAVSSLSSSTAHSSSSSTAATPGFKRLRLLDGSSTPVDSSSSSYTPQLTPSSSVSFSAGLTPSASQAQGQSQLASAAAGNTGLGLSGFPTQAKNVLSASFKYSASSSLTTGGSAGSSSNNLMSAEDRFRRSSVIVDPSSELRHGHRGQRSLETRMRVLNSSTFPSREYSDHIIASYFRNLAPLWHIHIDWLFEDEYREFWKLRHEGRFLEIDPAWAALFFITMALGLQVTEFPLPAHLNPLPSGTPNEIISMSDSYLSDVEELLIAAHWARVPQIRVLQTICLYSGFQSMTSLRDPTTFTMNGAGIRIAQMLGLHCLGPVDGPNVDLSKLADDLALPTGSDALKLHLARIIWHTAVVMELVHVTRVGLHVPLASTPHTTALPANVEDDDFRTLLANMQGPAASASSGALSPASAAAQTEQQIKMLAPREKPAWVLTGVSSLRCRALLSKIDMELLELPAEMKATEKYTHVMRIDSELRKWISAAPTRKASQNDYPAYKLSHWQHWSLMADVHGAIVHAHRPYMTRGYVDERFSFSTKTCIESAKVLCESWMHLRDYVTDQRFWWSSMRYLSAAIVIFIDLFQAMDDGFPEDVLTTKRADIPLILSILQERMQSMHTTTATFAAAAFGVVHNLLEAEKVKKAAMAARRNSADGSNVEDSEPVGRVFKRIAENLSGANASKVETSSSSSSTATAQSSPQDPLLSASAGIGSGSGTGNRTPTSASLTEQPTFPTPANAKSSGPAKQHKQVRQVAGRGSARGRNNAPKLSRLPPMYKGSGSTSTSAGGMSLPGSLPPMPQPELSPSAGAGAGAPSFTMPAVGNTMPELGGAMSQAYTAMIHPYAFQMQPIGTPVHDMGPASLEQVQLTPGPASATFPTYYPDSVYPFAGHATDIQMSGPPGSSIVPTHPSNQAAMYVEAQAAPPITWDTSSLFHPDTSVLLHSMGFPAAQYDGSYMPTHHQSIRHETPLLETMNQSMHGHTHHPSISSVSQQPQHHMQQPPSVQYQHHPSHSMEQQQQHHLPPQSQHQHHQQQQQTPQSQHRQHMHHQNSDLHSWYPDASQY